MFRPKAPGGVCTLAGAAVLAVVSSACATAANAHSDDPSSKGVGFSEAAADSVGPSQTRVHGQAASAAVVSDALIVGLIAQGRIKEARDAFASTNPSAVDWIFFGGRVSKAAGDFDRAKDAFGHALRLQPSFLPAKRELAHTLLIAAEYDAAARQFRDLLSMDPEEKYRPGYVRFLRQIDRLRPFSVNWQAALVTSSNVNRGSSESEFVPGVPDVPAFDITSQAESDVGVEASVLGRFRHVASNGNRITLDWALSGRKFTEPEFDNASVAARLRFGALNSKSRWSIGPTIRANATNNENDSVILGATADYERRVAKRLTLFASASYQYRFQTQAEDRDAPFYSLQTGAARAIQNGSLSTGARFVFFRPEKQHQRYDGQSAFARFSRAWSGGLEGGLGLEVGRRAYAGEFPLAGEAREDEFVQVTVSAQHNELRIDRFIPTVNCLVGFTNSNIAFFEHSVKECSVGVTTRF